MSWQKWTISGRKECETFMVDLEHEGSLFLPLKLVGDAADGILLEIKDKEVRITSGEPSFRMGEHLRPGTIFDLTIKNEPLIIAITDMEQGNRWVELPSGKAVTIGTRSENTITYTLEAYLRQDYCAIKADNGTAIIQPMHKDAMVYCKGKRLEAAQQLKIGDEIIIHGMTAVFMGKYLVINNPCSKVQIHLNIVSPEILPRASAEEMENFVRTTRIRVAEKVEHFTIDPPISPLGDNEGKLPAALVVGPAITMGVSSFASMAISVSNAMSNGGASALAGCATAAAMIAGMVLWPNLTKKYEKKMLQEAKDRRESMYLEYISKMEKQISDNVSDNLRHYNSTVIDPAEIANWYHSHFYRRLWERSSYDDDFLVLRLGTGLVENPSVIDITKGNYLSFLDALNAHAERLKEDYRNIQNAPLFVDLKKTNSVGLIGMPLLVRYISQSMIFQLASLHDCADLKIAVIYKESDTDLDWVKKLPHVWNDSMSFRYIAQTREEVQSLFRVLSEEMESRRITNANGKSAPMPAYAVFVLDQELAGGIPFSRILTMKYDEIGFSYIFGYGDIGNVPSGCLALINTSKDGNNVYENMDGKALFRQFERDNLPSQEFAIAANAMSHIKVNRNVKNAAVPKSVTFLDLFKVGNVEQLKIGERWSNSNPSKSLAVPIGMKSGGELFYLDIHEKFHGSHGLLAGTTGSGKSEALQSLLLSLAVYFHPDDISFVIIDFKGGGMAGTLKGLPHMAGSITNLGNQIQRSMISINAELRRRQKMLSDAGVNHIDKYQAMFHEGKVKEPMPHMVLVSDEFAELKQQQPEFMAQLISVARIGRSLGIHMILATQKPTGVVDDQIWSNTRFRICLKVADKADSMGMIGSPLSATITNAGRGYVQVGYNEIFELVQTGFTGANYKPTEDFIDLENQQITSIDGCGQEIGKASRQLKTIPCKKMTQIEAVIEHLADYAQKNHVDSHPIWPPELPEVMNLTDIPEYNKQTHQPFGKLGVVIGKIDDPYEQATHAFEIPMDKGHIMMYGMPGSGKTVFLQTMAYSLISKCKPEEVKIEILDFGGRTLDIFKDAPHVNHVFFPDMMEEITGLLERLEEEIESRRLIFAKKRQENLAAYNKVSDEKLPAIIIMIDNFGKFWENIFGGADELMSAYNRIVQEGIKYGVTLVQTGNTVNTLSYKLADYFPLKFTLQLTDPADYTSVVGSTGGMRPDAVKGRGLCRYEGRVCEFQVAITNGEVDDGLRGEAVTKELQEKYGRKKKTVNNVKPVDYEKPAITVPVKETPLREDSPKETPAQEIKKSEPEPEKKRSSIGGIPGFGKKKAKTAPSTVPSAATAPKEKNVNQTKSDKLPPAQKSTFEEGDLTVAIDRRTEKEFGIRLGEPITLLHKNGVTHAFPKDMAEQAAEKGIDTYIHGADAEGAVRADREKELDEVIRKMAVSDNKSVFAIMDLMKFYEVVSDASLDILVNLIRKEKVTVVMAASYSDVQILKDYPFGILMIKNCSQGLLCGGTPNDLSSVLPYPVYDAMSLQERKTDTGGMKAILFHNDGAYASVRLFAMEG